MSFLSRNGARPRTARSSKILTIGLWTCCIYFLTPFVWLILTSTKNDSGIFDSFGLSLSKPFDLFHNIGTVFTYENGSFGRWLLNSILYAGVSAVGAVALATPAGYAFAKYRFTGRTPMFSMVFGAITIPSTALALPTYLLFSHLNLTDTPLAVILPSMVNPFAMYLMMVYAQDAVDSTVMEAARIDGAGELRIFWQISMRLLRPAMVTIFLLALVATWNNYLLPLIMLNQSNLYPVTVGLAQWAASSSAGGGARVLYSTVITGSLVSVVPLVLSFLYLQRYWQSGLSAGAVKG